MLGNAAAGAAKTGTFLGEKYRRIARRRGSKRAIVALGRSILVIAWHLLSTPTGTSATSAPAATPPASTPNAASSATSASSKPSATPSPSNQPPDPPAREPGSADAPPGAAARPVTHQFSD